MDENKIEEIAADENTMSEDTLEFTEDEMYISAVMPRLHALLDIATDTWEMEADLSIDGNAHPVIKASAGGLPFLLTYFVTDEGQMDHFMLVVRAFLETALDQTSLTFGCESFNLTSILGYALPLDDGRVEYRAQLPESGGMSAADEYTFLFQMIRNSIASLVDTLQEEM